MEDTLKSWLKALKLNESTISMILGGLVVVVVGVLIYNYFTSVDQGLPKVNELETGELQLVEEDGVMIPQGLPTSHIVASGEDLWKIAKKYYGSGYNWVDVAKENNLANPDRLLVGQELVIPKTGVIKPPSTQISVAGVTNADVIEGSSYQVQRGDSLWKIAVRAYQDGYKWPEIAAANQDKVVNPDLIEVGMVLNLPGK